VAKIKTFLSTKPKAIFYIISPVVISFIIICSILFVSLYRSQLNYARADFDSIVKKHTRNFESKIIGAIEYLAAVSSIMEFMADGDFSDREMLQKMLFEIFDKNHHVDSSSIYFEPDMFDGKDSEYRGTLYGTNLSGRICFFYFNDNAGNTAYLPEAVENDIEFALTHYIDLKNSNVPVYTEPMVFNINGEEVFMFMILFPVRDKNGNFIGAVTADIHLMDIYAELREEQIFETGYMLISNDNNRVIYSPIFSDIGKTREEAGLIHSLPSITEKTVFHDTTSIINGKKSLAGTFMIHVPLLDRFFGLSVVAPVSEINASGTKILFIIISISIFIVIIITSILFILINIFTKPLADFTESADKIARGDYSVRITGEYKDEYSILKDTLNHMSERIEGAMDESNNSLRVLQNMLNGINAIIYVSVPETGELLFINEKLKKSFGITDEAIGRHCYEVLQDGFTEMCDFCPCFQLNKNPDVQVQWEEFNTVTKKYYHNTDCYIEWLGGKMVHLQYSFDITDIKLITEEKIKAEETSRMKSVFLASMSHEIRTPMHGIIGFSELALDDNIPIKTRNYLSKIKTSAESLLMIINDILDVSKIEAGKMELEKIPFDVSEVFKLCRMIASPKAREKGLTLFCYAEPSIDRMLLGDSTRLRQILLNLLSNAVKFTNNGTIKLLSAITERTENTVTMHFEVKDSGIGMTEEQIERIFQPFVQADSSTTRKYGGTGLGLTITNSFIKLMGSKLEVESNIGLGSKFSFDITFDTIDITKDSSHLSNVINVNDKPVFEAEILVCEDNSLNQMVISDHLSKVGIKTVVAENGKIGVDYVKDRIKNNKKQFDLIFMDIHMPEMDGLDASKKLAELGVKIPIIALTANIMANDRETYFEAGMCDCLAKPFVAHELWSCLLKYLKPVSMVAVKTEVDSSVEEDLRFELIAAFVKGNQTTISEIKNAIDTGDLKLAHRISHTLKGVSGLVGMNILAETAKMLEQAISSNYKEHYNDLLDRLENELNKALDEFKPIIEEYMSKIESMQPDFIDDEKALEILNTLDTLLASDSFDCLNLVNDLTMIPGTDELLYQVENLKFKQARQTLAEIKRRMM